MQSLCCLLIIFTLSFVSSVTVYAAQFVGVVDKKPATLAEVIKTVQGTDVIFIGETHDEAQHHQAHLDIVKSLHAKKIAFAIGLEMFTSEDQQPLDDWVAGSLDEERFIPIYARNWSYDWQVNRELFIFARDNHIPLVALNVPKAVIAKVVAQGPAALQDSDAPPNTAWSLNETQTAYMRTITRQAFGATPPERIFTRMCQAQVLRNSGMAWRIAKYKSRHGSDKVVVLAGVWHAVKNGVPELLTRYGKFSYKVILPELPEFNRENATVSEADYLMVR